MYLLRVRTDIVNASKDDAALPALANSVFSQDKLCIVGRSYPHSAVLHDLRKEVNNSEIK